MFSAWLTLLCSVLKSFWPGIRIKMFFNFPHLRITTFGKGLALALSLVVASIILTSVITLRQSDKMASAWQAHNTITARKTVILSHLRGLLGFDGMIHHYKNFILRRERSRAVATYKKMLEMSIALTAYQSLGLTANEEGGVNILIDTIDKYRSGLKAAEKFAAASMSPIEIDKIVKIDDTSATIALAILENELHAAQLASEDKVHGTVENLISFVTFSALLTGLFVLALVSWIIWYVRTQLVAPLNALVGAFQHINPHKPDDGRLPSHGSDPGYELNFVARAGNAFLKATEEHLIKLDQTEYALRASEAHLRSVVETAVDAIITIDINGEIQSFNTAAVNVFNYSLDEVIGSNVKMLMPEPDRSAHDGYLKAYNTTGRNKIIGIGREVTGRRKNGDHFPMWLAVSETKSANNKHFTGIIRDISAEKEAEIKVRMAKEAADQANRAKSEFLSSMSHELRTPMNAILGFAQLLESNPKEPLSAPQKEYIGMILQSGDHLLELIKQVLELSQIEAGHLIVSFEKVTILPLVQECLDSLTPRAENRNLSLIYNDSAGSNLDVWSDPVRLKQVLLNLLSNAVKYNQDNGSVAVSCQARGNNMVRISISDTGSGIPENKQKYLFTPFDRLGREAGQIEGTGIGLSITKKLVTALKGSINFTSAEGQGSTFWIDLPVQDQD
jgi:PAS domain S-box-containing protein